MKVKFVKIYNGIYFGVDKVDNKQRFWLRFPRCIFLDKRWQDFNSEFENATFNSMEDLKEFIKDNQGKLNIDAEELINKLNSKIQIIKKENSLEEKEKKSKLVGWWI